MPHFTITPTREQWNALRYPVLIEPDEAHEGFYAWIPALGRGAFMADGDTVQEALDALEELRREQYDLIVASGRPIPRPDADDEEPIASGKFLLRTTPRFHAELRTGAEGQGVSLNEYANHCLMIGHAHGQIASVAAACLSAMRSEAARIRLTALKEGATAARRKLSNDPEEELLRILRFSEVSDDPYAFAV